LRVCPYWYATSLKGRYGQPNKKTLPLCHHHGKDPCKFSSNSASQGFCRVGGVLQDDWG